MPLCNYVAVVTGTDPSSCKGGIGIAMPGYLTAMEGVGIAYESVPTYHPSEPGGRLWWWLRTLPALGWYIISRRFYGQRVIVYSHAGAGISLLREGILIGLSRFCGAKTVIHIHALEVEDYLHHTLKRFLFRLVVFPASAVAVLTPWWRERLSDAGINKQIFVIPNPLPQTWEERALSMPVRKVYSKEIVLLTMTRAEPGKGIDLIIDTMPLLPETVRLVVAGDGSQLRVLKKRARELGIDARVCFMGWVVGEDKQRLLDQADIFCLPSSYDSFGMGFLEAMANGLPVVALDWGPISDVVANGRCGILIRDKNPKNLAEAIKRMTDPDFRRQMGKEAKRWVLEQFGSKTTGASIRTMFECVLKR